jgi:sodium pump decarboxylase gamma subunit
VFGETITFVESMVITFLGMSVVFLALVFLMVIIKVMEKVLYKGTAKKKVPEPSAPTAAVTAGTTPAVGETASRSVSAVSSSAMTADELIAVISAAAAACMSTGDGKLVVRSIVRLPDTTPIWGVSGRLAQQGKRL